MKPFREQRVALFVGLVLGAVVAVGAFFGLLFAFAGHEGTSTTPARPAPARHAHYTLRPGNTVRAPLAATRCVASGEGGRPDLFCTRTGGGRFQVVFYSDAVLVYHVGNPDAVRAFRWAP